MRTIINEIKNCDGRFCEAVMMHLFGLVTLSVMIISICQI